MAILHSNGILIVDAIPVHTPSSTEAIIAWDNVLNVFYYYNGGWTILTIPEISDVAYDATSWNGVTDVAPSKNAIRDLVESLIVGMVPDGDYGDIVVSGGGTVFTIDSNAVTLTQLQNISTDSLLGRDTAGSGDPEVITVGGGLEFTGAQVIQRSALTGDIAAPAGSNVTTLANNTVSNAKLAPAATDILLGRDTAGVGNIEYISLDPTLEFTGSLSIRRAAIGGDIVMSAGSNSALIPNDTITHDKYQNIATDKLLARTTAGSGNVEEIDFSDYSQGLVNLANEAALKAYINLEIGTDVQAYDATLTALAGLNGTTGIVVQTAADTFTKRTLIGTSNEITVTFGDGVGGNPTLSLPTTIDLSSKTSFAIPVSAAPTVNSDGEIAVDTTVADFSHGVVKLFATEELAVITVPIAELSGMTDGDVIKYNATADEFQISPEGALDPTLTALAAYNTNGILVQTAPDTFVGRSVIGTADEIDVNNGDGVGGNIALSLASYVDLSDRNLEIPNSAGLTLINAGQIGLDTTAAEFGAEGGYLLQGNNNTCYVVYILASDLGNLVNNATLAYDETATAFVVKSQPKYYRATLTQTGANPPAEVFTDSTLSGAVNLQYVGVGIYSIELAAEFPTQGKVYVEAINVNNLGDDKRATLSWVDTGTLHIEVFDSTGTLVEAEGHISIGFKIYP